MFGSRYMVANTTSSCIILGWRQARLKVKPRSNNLRIEIRVDQIKMRRNNRMGIGDAESIRVSTTMRSYNDNKKLRLRSRTHAYYGQ